MRKSEGIVQPIEIASYQELISRLRDIEPKDPDNGLISYRGQVRDYPQITASMVRRVGSDEFDLKATVYGHGFWASVAEEIAEEHLPVGQWDPAEIHRARVALGEGLLQHYGFQTYFVDVTFNPDIAVCFAHYAYRDLYPVLDGDIDRPKLRRVAWYEPSPEPYGYFYVFDCERWRARRGHFRHGHVIQLSNLARPGWTRVQMQQAMLIHSDPRQPNLGDLRPLVRAIYKFSLPLKGCDQALEESRQWFPSPKTDPIYRLLLGSKFVQQTYIADHPKRVWRRLTTDTDALYLQVEIPAFKEITMLRRTLEIPEYHEDRDSIEEIEFFRSFDQVLNPTFYFFWLKSNFHSPKTARETATKRSPDAKVLREVAQARGILVNAPFGQFKHLDGNVARVRYEAREPSFSVFFEFSMYNFSGPYSDERAIRGVWIAGSAEHLRVAVLGAKDDWPWVSGVGRFDWSKDGYQESAAGHPGMRSYLLLALTLLWDIDLGRAEVLPLHDGDQQMRYPIELEGRPDGPGED